MEGIIFTGIQASGKSTFYKERFFNTHIRISLDLLNTRNKENQFFEKCLALQQRLVIDNTNPTIVDRQKYIQKLKERKFKIIGYYFHSKVEDAVERNSKRVGKAKIPNVGIYATTKKMELPTLDEGFDELYRVEIINQDFVIKDWKNEI
ncbi:MAG: AAA family ATPase [Saprospiraceae bacterium]